MAISAAEYQRRLQTVNTISVLQDLAYELIIKDETTILGLKEQDFLEGDIYGNGTLVGYNSSSYEAMKSRMNPLAGGAVDLILTGDFVNAMFIAEPNNGVYHFGNNDPKSALLSSQYGMEIFGLNQDVFNRYQVEILAPRFIRLIKDTAKIQ